MSTKPCPQCGSVVPAQARFCGQCGRTFNAEAAPNPAARTVPTTVDEATADPPPVEPAPAPRPHAGVATMFGHAAVAPGAAPVAGAAPLAVPGAAPALGMDPLGAAPTPRRPAAPTALGPAVAPPPATFAKTTFDPSPYGAAQAAPESVAVSQRPTVVAPPPEAETKPVLAQTLADPQVAERAREILALAEAVKPTPVTPGPSANDPPAPRPAPALGKTMLLGGEAPAAVAVPEPAPAIDTSPLSKSVVAPSAGALLAPAGSVQSAPNASPAAIAGPAPAPAPAATAAQALGAPGSDKQTMFGMPAVGLPAPVAQPTPPAAIPPAFKTMLGVALPGIAPTHEKPPAQPAPAQRAGTLLGVAAPGIAPSAAQVHPAHPAHRFEPPAAPAPPIVPAPAPLVVEPLPEAPRVPKKKGIPAVAVVGIVFVLVAIIGTGAALVILRAGAPLSAQPQLDETGKESLRIRCESCPDGTVISLGASSSKVDGAATILPLPAPLSIGDNDLEMTIDRPPPGRDETVKVHVPVAYRVKADLSTLTVAPAAITVRVEALAGTEVTVDGKPVALDASGKGWHAIDVSSEVEGPSDDQKTIDKKVPFTIKAKGAAAPENGQLVVRTGVAPLLLDAPGRELYTDRPTGNIAGQVKPGGTVLVDGQNVAVDAQGRFGVRVELPADGEKTLTIVANAPPLAPRTVRSKLVRVASLDAAAKTIDAKSPLTFDAYGSDPASKVGQLATVDGEIQEIRVGQGHTVMAVEDKKTCTASKGACVVRVVHGEEIKAARGDSVRAYGRIEGTATLNGQTIPDLEGALVLTKAAKK